MILFHSAEEYIAEMLLDAAAVDPKIVRLTREYKSSSNVPFWSLNVIATHRLHGELVFLRAYIGSVVMPSSPAFNTKPEAWATLVCKQISDAAERVGLLVRRGSFAPDHFDKEV